METKTCPSCGAEVPASAGKCKACFYDFAAAPKAKSSSPLAILAGLAGAAVIAALVFSNFASRPTDHRMLVDVNARAVQWVTQFQDGHLETDSLPFDRVVSLEYVNHGSEAELNLLLTDGSRKLMKKSSDGRLRVEADDYAKALGKPLTVNDPLEAGTAPVEPGGSPAAH